MFRLPNEPSLEQLSDLIGSIYDCALDPGLWSDTLQRMSEQYDFCNSGIGIQEMPSGRPLLVTMTGTEEPYASALYGFGSEIVEVFGGLQKMQTQPMDEPMVFSRDGPPPNWATSRYNLEWIEPQGIIDALALILARDSQTYSSLSFGRHVSAGKVGDLEVDTFRFLVPHLQRAVRISRILDIQTVAASSFAATLDALASAVLLVGSDMRIVHANQTAERILAEGQPLFERGGLLSVRDEAAGAALAMAVRDSHLNEAIFGRRGLGIPLRDARGKPMVLHVLPLQHTDMRSGLKANATAAIFVAAASAPLPAANDAVAVLFDLTPAETRVFGRMAEGASISETAKALGVSPSTVKTHLLRLFAKTGTRRQAELVKLGASLALTA